MKIDSDKFANYVLVEILRLKAQTEVLKGAIGVLVETMKPGSSAELLKSLEALSEDRFRTLLVDHPFVQDEFDDLLSSAFPKD